MSLSVILVLSLVAFLISWLSPEKWRINIFLLVSLVSIFWLQPTSTIRYLDFWLPITVIFLALIVWIITQSPTFSLIATFWQTPVIVLLTIIGLSALRYLGPFCCLTASRPPPLSDVFIYLLIAFAIVLMIVFFSNRKKSAISLAFIGIVLLLVVQKTPALTESASVFLRKITGQDVQLASSLDISWLGFSYLSFRLLHILLDKNAGRLGKISLNDFLVYALFFPSYISGPIDRVQRFSQDLHSTYLSRQPTSIFYHLISYCQSDIFLKGSQRILVGIFKKFVLADGLALISINNFNAEQINRSPWIWVLVYAYSLRIYLDFSGYTDIAIGLGNLLGIKLPENFSKPYTKTNLTTFWNSWHITLSQWFRAYFFNPFTRWLRTHPKNFPVWSIVLFGQLGVMLLIGLWHGITWNFLIWGLWHAIGLFIHNRWADWSRSFLKKIPETRSINQIRSGINWFITFNYVSLGWVWFALSDPVLSISIFKKLFNIMPGW